MFKKGGMHMQQQLIAACQMFLIPSTILFAALAAAPTEPLKDLICLMGMTTTGIWFNRVRLWLDLSAVDRQSALALSGVFLAAWIVAFAVHLYWWAHG
jgi:hypothetical protein